MKIFVLAFIFMFCGANALNAQGTYTGTGSVTQGLGVTTTANLMPGCSSNHLTPLGKITSSDKKEWIVPAETNFLTGPYATDLHNSCNKFEPTTLSSVNLNSVPVKVIDTDGEVITGFIFCDNYFELYVNGELVAVDPVPFTPFNSCVVKFKVSKPYTIAVKLVDWEENVGLGSEIQSPTVLYHPGDGGFIAQFSDGTVTDASWKTQTFYIAPIQNLGSVVELPDGTRSTATATTNPTCNANCYGIHYEIPSNWNIPAYNDSGWPAASLYTAAQVTNSTAYTNFAASAWPKAKFIWSSNLILDNIVLSRKTVVKSTNTSEVEEKANIQIGYHDATAIFIKPENDIQQAEIILSDLSGKTIQRWQPEFMPGHFSTDLKVDAPLQNGTYIITIQNEKFRFTGKLAIMK